MSYMDFLKNPNDQRTICHEEVNKEGERLKRIYRKNLLTLYERIHKLLDDPTMDNVENAFTASKLIESLKTSQKIVFTEHEAFFTEKYLEATKKEIKGVK